MSWEPRHERLYKDGVLIRHRVQRTPDGEWEDYVPEEPPPVKKAHTKAFPNMTSEKGMDLRDYFAAKAMQAMLASPELLAVVTADEVLGDNSRERCARCAYNFADAMMKAREE